MESAGPTVPDETTVLSEYCMDGEARSPHRNLPYPDGTLDESSVRSEYYRTGNTEEDGTTGSSDSNLGTDPGYPEIDARNTISSDSSVHSIHPEDYNTRYRSMFRSPYSSSSSSSSTSSSDSNLGLDVAYPEIDNRNTVSSDSNFTVLSSTRHYPMEDRHHDRTASSSSSTTSSSFSDLSTHSSMATAHSARSARSYPFIQDFVSDWDSIFDPPRSQSDEPPDNSLLMNAIPSPYGVLVIGSLGQSRLYSPVQLYEALENAIDAVREQEKWKVAKAENPLERARRIRKLRADDEIRSASDAPEKFSRACGVCYADAPATRAVLTACGHLVCAPCAMTIASGGGRLVCPYCRANTGYVILVEEKEEEDSLASDEDPSDAQTKEGIDDDVENPLDYAVYVPYEEFVRIVNSNSN